MNNKINIEQITCWRAGEVMLEQNLNEVFALIGTTINAHIDDVVLLESKLNKLHLASRWVGQVEDFTSIQALILDNKNKPEYQPPNDPLPTSGDVIMVTNNSDDPNLPADINPGKYLYIYLQDPLEPTKGKWEIYNPFALVNASRVNDGLMSKEDYIKLNDLPDATSLTFKFEGIEEELELHLDQIKKINAKVTQNKIDIDGLKPRVTLLEQNKQDKATDITNYKTKNVVDNLQEVKTEVDFIRDQNIVIWEDSDTPLLATQADNIYTIAVALDRTKYEDKVFIQPYLKITDTSDIEYTAAPLVKMFSKDTSLKSSFVLVIGLKTLMCSIQYKDNSFVIEVIASDPKDLTLIKSIELLKVIKNIGVSDYMWVESITNDLKAWLANNLGTKEMVIPSRVTTDDFNGYRANEFLNLTFTYMGGTNAIEVYIGGTRGTKGVEFSEVVKADGSPCNQIQFLRDIDIEKEGAIEIRGTAIVLNTFVVKPWDKKTLWTAGSIVFHNKNLWYATQDNQGQEPSASSKYWSQFEAGVNVDELMTTIKDYIDRQVPTIVDDRLETYVKGAYEYVSKGMISSFENGNAAIDVKRNWAQKQAYIINDDKTTRVLDVNEPWWEQLANDSAGHIVVKWKYSIYSKSIADIKVLTATPDEVTTAVNAALAKEYKSTTNMYLVYDANDDASLDKWLKEVGYTRDDIEIIDDTLTPRIEALETKTKSIETNLANGTPISVVEAPLGFTLNGKRVYGKYVSGSIASNDGTLITTVLVNGVDKMVFQCVSAKATSGSSEVMNAFQGVLPIWYHGSFKHLEILVKNNNLVLEKTLNEAFEYSGVIWYTKVGE